MALKENTLMNNLEENNLTREQLITSNLKLVYKIVNSYNNHYCYDDLVSEGFYGLIKAADHYDPSKGSFSTIAYIWINKYIKKYFEKNKKYNEVLSLDVEVDEDSSTTLVDLIPDNYDNKIKRNNIINDELSNCLDEKEYDVVCQLGGLGEYDKCSVDTIAKSYNVEKKEIEKIKKSASIKIAANPYLKDIATDCFCN